MTGTEIMNEILRNVKETFEYKVGYRHGREDAIEEICKMANDYCDNCNGECFDCQLSVIHEFADRIKERKE